MEANNPSPHMTRAVPLPENPLAAIMDSANPRDMDDHNAASSVARRVTSGKEWR